MSDSQVQELEQALQQIAEMLAADGYELRVWFEPSTRETVNVVIHAGKDACEDCLVPKPVMTQIISGALADQRLPHDVVITYPTD